MEFNFTNVTFSFLASIVVAVLGTGYPLFLGSIREIDAQYKSTRLAKRFKNECIFRVYYWVLVSSIAASIIAPFMMMIFNNVKLNIIIIIVQCIVVLLLVGQMLWLFRLIHKYYDIEQICRHLDINGEPDNDNGCNEEKLLCAVEIMKYASCNGNRYIFEKCKAYLCWAVNKESQRCESDTYDMGRHVQKSFMQIAHYSRDKDNVYLHNECVIAECLYSAHPKRFNGENNLRVLWQSLLLMMDTDSTVWFRDYWRRAVQYYFMDVSNMDDESEVGTEVIMQNWEFFKEMHWMVGAALVYYQKYEWLRFALFYSSISPVKYPLVPSSFILIMKGMTKIRKMLDSVEEGLSVEKLERQIPCKYQIEIYHEDKEAASMMLKLASKYFALLVIRLFNVNNYNITHSEPMDAPSIPENDSEKYYMGKAAQDLYANIDFWYIDNLIYRLQLPNVPQEEDVKALLKSCTSKIETPPKK